MNLPNEALLGKYETVSTEKYGSMVISAYSGSEDREFDPVRVQGFSVSTSQCCSL
jgi:hypothetical protein